MTSAIEQWKTRVESHHAQSIKAEKELPESNEDFWAPLVSVFKDDPRRTDDSVLNRLARDVTSDTTVLDVGGGAGRFALPLALRCGHVTVVEPSESMAEGLREGTKEAGIDNLSIVQGSWEEVMADPADMAICAHVVYGIAEIEPFIRKLVSHARERVMILSFMESPLSQISPLWKLVHGEERIDLPALPEILNVLWEMGIYPDVEMFEAMNPRSAENRDEALKMLRKFLYVTPETEKDNILEKAMKEMVDETPDGLVLEGTRPRRQGLVSWGPE
ncbi:MAG: class I SAM-dependent methyltransferase [Dehalococcoidia bacterium]